MIEKAPLEKAPPEIWNLIIRIIIDSGDNTTLLSLSRTHSFFKDYYDILPLLFNQIGPKRVDELTTRLISLIPHEKARNPLIERLLPIHPRYEENIYFEYIQVLDVVNEAFESESVRWIDLTESTLEWTSITSFINAARKYRLRMRKGFGKLFLLLILYVGIYRGQPELTKIALEQGISPFPLGAMAPASLFTMPSPLEACAQAMDIEQARIILPVIQRLNGSLRCPSLLLVRGVSVDLFQLLVEGGAYWSDREEDFLDTVKTCSFEYIRPYLDSNIQLNSRSADSTALHIATLRGESETVSQLLRRGAQCDLRDANDRTPLHIACEEGHVEIAALLLKYGPMLVASTTPVHLAAKNGHEAVLQLLLPYNDSDWSNISDWIDEEVGTALHYAAWNGHAGAVKLLLSHGSNPGRQNGAGELSVHLAAQEGHLDVLEILFDIGYPGELANARCALGESCLHRAIRNGHREVTYFLVNHKGNVNARDKNGQTPLHHLAFGKNYEIGWLFGIGCDLDTQDNLGETALHCALREGRWLLLRELVVSGANIDLMNESGNTPRLLAQSISTSRYDVLKTWDLVLSRNTKRI